MDFISVRSVDIRANDLVESLSLFIFVWKYSNPNSITSVVMKAVARGNATAMFSEHRCQENKKSSF